MVPLPVEVGLLNSLTLQYYCTMFLSVYHVYILNVRWQRKAFENKEIDDLVGHSNGIVVWFFKTYSIIL